jgi:hypothetical protein
MSDGLAFTVYVDTAEQADTVVARLQELCRPLGVQPDIRVVDVTSDPRAAEAANVIGTPTVVRESPGPRRRLIGALDDSRRVSMALGIDGWDEGEQSA